MIWFFLTSGLFLGWSLGANDAANVFGTAVGTRMVKFRTAAIVTCLFVALGAVISGAGATHTLGKLGAVNAMAGSFTVALAAGATVTWMTRAGLPVSTSQAIVGAIVGWNLFTGSPTGMTTLTTIVSTWVLCPLLAALLAFLMFKLVRWFLNRVDIHLLRKDAYNRFGLILAGAFGAYSLGANNIANVMGVFVPASPFPDFTLFNGLTFSGTQALFLLGAIAIGVGVVTYSKNVMLTVGGDLLRLTPVAALIVVLSHSLVLFLFASRGLEAWLAGHGLPTIPLVPVSSSQAAIGAVIGIGLAKGGRGLNFRVLGRIASGWVTTPLAAAVLAFVALFFVQNVFEMEVVQRPSSAVTWDTEASGGNRVEGRPWQDSASATATATTGPETTPDFARVFPGKASIGREVVVSQTNWPTPVAITPGAAGAYITAVAACPEGKVPIGGGGWVTGAAGGWYMITSRPVRPDTPICPGDPVRHCAWSVTWESETGDPDNPNASGVGTFAYAICAAVK